MSCSFRYKNQLTTTLQTGGNGGACQSIAQKVSEICFRNRADQSRVEQHGPSVNIDGGSVDSINK